MWLFPGSKTEMVITISDWHIFLGVDKKPQYMMPVKRNYHEREEFFGK